MNVGRCKIGISIFIQDIYLYIKKRIKIIKLTKCNQCFFFLITFYLIGILIQYCADSQVFNLIFSIKIINEKYVI